MKSDAAEIQFSLEKKTLNDIVVKKKWLFESCSSTTKRKSSNPTKCILLSMLLRLIINEIKDATERADFKSNTQKTRLNFLTAYMSITYKCRIM